MSAYFAAMWRHIHACSTCNKLDRGLCAEGDRLLDVAVRAGGAS